MTTKNGGKYMVWSFSKITEEQIKAIDELEKKMDIVLLAFSDQVESAKLGDSDLKQIKDLEKELNLSLVAVKQK